MENQHDFLNTSTLETHEAIESDERNFGVFPISQYRDDHLLQSNVEDLDVSKWFFRKLFNESAIQFGNDDYQITIDPHIDLKLGSDNNRDDYLYRNQRGYRIRATIGDKFYATTDLAEVQERLPLYLERDIVRQRFADSGHGTVLRNHGITKSFKEGGVDYTTVNAQFGFKLDKYFDLSFGRGKHFWGWGHRSLLLSDNANSYPFLKVNTQIGPFNYTNLFTQYRDVRFSNDGTFIKKYSANHLLSMNVTKNKKLKVGVFESVIYSDSSGTRGFEIEYLNPIIFYRPIEFALGSAGGNVLIGAMASYAFNSKTRVYGQFILDEFKISEIRAGNGWVANKYGVQLGAKFYDILKVPNLNGMIEVNSVRPYTYSHRDENSLQTYGHYNQELAHPLGANFHELIVQGSYRWKRYFSEAKLVAYQKGFDATSDLNFGGDIFKPYTDPESDYDNEIGQGAEGNIIYANVKLGYLVNPSSNLRLYVDATIRETNNDIVNGIAPESSQILQVGLSTDIFRDTRDL